MKHTHKHESPPPQIKQRESPTLLRAIAAAYAEEVAATTDYTYGQILFENSLPSVAGTLEAISRTEMHHYLYLGRLLRDLGASPALRATIGNTPYQLNEDADSHAPVLAQRVLKDRIRDEKNAAMQYKRLADAAVTEQARTLLSALSKDETEHAHLLESIVQRLALY